MLEGPPIDNWYQPGFRNVVLYQVSNVPRILILVPRAQLDPNDPHAYGMPQNLLPPPTMSFQQGPTPVPSAPPLPPNQPGQPLVDTRGNPFLTLPPPSSSTPVANLPPPPFISQQPPQGNIPTFQ